MKKWIGLVLTVVSAACQVQPALPDVSVATQETTAEPFVTPACVPASGVTLKIQKMSDTAAEVIATGLQPEEQPYLWYGIPGGRWSGGDMNSASAQGEFYHELNDLEPPTGQTTATWDVRLANARGIACAQITLP